MWYVVLSGCILLFLTVWLFVATSGRSWDKVENRVIGLFVIWLLGGVVLGLAGLPVLRFTTGFWEDYSEGQRDGYVTKFARKGIIFKTWEAQLQIGTGAQAALQEPWAFSVPDEYANEVQAALGSHVRVSYTQFLLMPWRLGETQYLVTDIETIE